jgi:hypothetical protein
MDPNKEVFKNTLKCLLAFPQGLDALQAVMSERLAYLAKVGGRAAKDACYDLALRPKALELLGRERELQWLMDLINELRRSV